MNKANLRVWGVWLPDAGRLEFVDPSQSLCRSVRSSLSSRGVTSEIIRFDISPLSLGPTFNGVRAFTKYTKNKEY